MSVISQTAFRELYGPGRGIQPHEDDRHTGQAFITALADHFRPARVLELGINVGETAKAILDNAPYVREYIGVDRPDMWYKRADSDRPGQLMDDYRISILTPEGGTRGLQPGDIDPVDFIFVDDDHTRAAVEFSTRLAYGLISRRGVIVWHDYNSPRDVGIREYLHEINERDRGGRIVHIEKTWLAYEITL